jgi:hypothetical protein
MRATAKESARRRSRRGERARAHEAEAGNEREREVFLWLLLSETRERKLVFCARALDFAGNGIGGASM